MLGVVQGAGAGSYLGGASGIYVTEGHAFVASEKDNAIACYDVRNPANPVLSGFVEGAGKPGYLGGAKSIFIKDNICLLYTSRCV